MATLTETANIQKLVSSMFNLALTSALQTNLQAAIDGGATLSELATTLAGKGAFDMGADAAAQSTTLLTNLGLATGTTAGDAASTYILARLAAGVNIEQVAVAVITYMNDDTKRHSAFDDTATLLTNKATVSQALVDSGIVATSLSDLDYLTSVDATAASVTTATAAVTAATPATPSTNPGSAFALTATADTFVGTTGDDTFTGAVTAVTATTTYTNTDVLLDQSSTDNDTLNVATNAAVTFGTVSGIENVNITTAMSGALVQSAANLAGVTTLTIARDDLAGGAISGSGTAQVTNADASKVANIVTGSQVTALNVDYSGGATQTAGIIVNAAGVTGNVTVDGSATITANDSITTVSIDGAVGGTAEDAKASSITANAAATVTTHADLTGAITVNAAAATTITVNDAQGGATVNGATAATTAATVTVKGIDASGADVTVGTGAAATTTIAVDLQGTTATSDTATVNAAGVIALDAGGATGTVDALTLTGSTAAATYTVSDTAGDGITSITGSGSNAVNVTTTSDIAAGVTMTGINTLKLSATATAGTLDLSNIAATTINIAADNANDAITIADGANILISAASQTTGLNLLAADGSTVTITAGDNTTTTAQSTTTLVAVDLGAALDFATVNLVAEDSRIAGAALDVGTAAIVITGDENVTFTGDVTAASITAGAFTGILTITTGAGGVNSITSGTGADVIEVDNALITTLDGGTGNNDITITNTASGSTFITGLGTDNFNIDSAIGNGAFVVQGGAGNDTYDISVDADVVITDSAGTADTIIIAAGGIDFSDNTNFAFSGIEAMTVTATNGTTTMAGADLTGKTITVTGDSATADILLAAGADAVADTIDLSDITATLSMLKIDGGTGADILTASANGTTFVAAAGDIVTGDTMNGGAGTDVIDYTGAAALDLTVATITLVDTVNTNGENLTLQQGTGVTTVADYADGTAGTLILTKSSTSFEATAEAAAVDVNVAGEWFFLAELVGADAALTYYDEVAGEAVTIDIDGTIAVTNDDTASSIAGNIVVEIA